MAREELVMSFRDLRRYTGRRSSGQARSSDAISESAPAFDDVYRRYFKPVYSFLAYRLDNRSAAEDLTSQVFEKAWRGSERFDPGKSSLSTWIFTIARNCLTDHYRKHSGKPREVELPSDLQDDGHEPRALEIGSELKRALGGLSDREREIISLKFGAALTNRKIAELLEITESNVGTILCRSLKKMKTQLEGGIEND